MSKSANDYLVNRPSEWGTNGAFGFPNDGISGMLGVLDRQQNKVELVLVWYEKNGIFIAPVYAKFPNAVAVFMTTSGQVAVYLHNGLYEAKMDQQLVLVIIRPQARDSLGGRYQQENVLISLYKDVTRKYVHMTSSPTQVRYLSDRSIRIAKNYLTATCMILPNDVQEKAAVGLPPCEHGTLHNGIGHFSINIVPQEDEIKKRLK